jgi:ribosomal-protein-alanine N-acetyltransferase
MLTWFAREDTPVLTGPRVTLRAPRQSDYGSWRDLRRLSRDFLKPFEPRWSESDLGPRVFSARLKRGREEARSGSDFSYFLFIHKSGTEILVGGITLSNIRRRAAQFVNLGYWMGHPYAGQGLMTEAVGLTIPFCFDTLGLHRMHAAFLPGNMASRRVLEKNGFREEGFAENYLQIDGKWADHVLFGLTRERYEAALRHRR